MSQLDKKEPEKACVERFFFCGVRELYPSYLRCTKSGKLGSSTPLASSLNLLLQRSQYNRRIQNTTAIPQCNENITSFIRQSHVFTLREELDMEGKT